MNSSSNSPRQLTLEHLAAAAEFVALMEDIDQNRDASAEVWAARNEQLEELLNIGASAETLRPYFRALERDSAAAGMGELLLLPSQRLGLLIKS